jgi:autotransporter-associated beta strand protein
VTAGTLRVQNPTALGSAASGTSVTSGATVQIENLAITKGEQLTLNGTGVGGTAGALAATGTASSNGPVSLASNSSVSVATGGHTLTLSGVVSGSGAGLTKVGAGTLVLSGANLYDGATAINGGNLPGMCRRMDCPSSRMGLQGSF